MPRARRGGRPRPRPRALPTGVSVATGAGGGGRWRPWGSAGPPGAAVVGVRCSPRPRRPGTLDRGSCCPAARGRPKVPSAPGCRAAARSAALPFPTPALPSAVSPSTGLGCGLPAPPSRWSPGERESLGRLWRGSVGQTEDPSAGAL